METSTLSTSDLREDGVLHTGEMTVLASVHLEQYTDETSRNPVGFTLTE